MTRFTKFKAALFVILCASFAYAVVQGIGTVDIVNSPRPQWFQSGEYRGSAAKNPLSDTRNKQAYHLCGVVNEDLASASQFAATGVPTVCVTSQPITIKGCAYNDRISLGVDQAQVNDQGTIRPLQPTATTFKVQACATGIDDGGSFNMPDASYTICCDGY